MGCPVSKSDDSSGDKVDGGNLAVQSQKRFPVKNLDDQNRVVGEGEIEITQSDLVLHAVAADPVRWPLRYLRRYGFDESLFSFESGRRCPTGEGIYAFSTKQAKTIFTLVEHNVRYGPKTAPGTEDTHDGGANGGPPQQPVPPLPNSPDDADDPPPLSAPHIVKVQEQKKINYIEIEIAGGGGGSAAPLPKPVQRTPYIELVFPQDSGGASAESAPRNTGLNYIQVNFDERAQGGANAPAQAVSRTAYTDVQLPNPGVNERRGSEQQPVSPQPSSTGPTEYTPINFKAMEFIAQNKN